jgi:hypothetical protein
MELRNEAYVSALTGINAADGDKVPVKDVSAESGTDNGNKFITLQELALALLRTSLYTGADAGTLALAVKTHTAKLTKATAGAYTLVAPTAAQEGTLLVVTNGTAAAHTITATGLIEDGVTGGAKTTATFAAFVGATIVLLAVNLKWHTVSLKAVTVA